MDKMHIPPPTEMTWEFDQGGVIGQGDDSYEGAVSVSYSDHIVTIRVGNNMVRLAEGKIGTQVGLAIYGALSVADRS